MTIRAKDNSPRFSDSDSVFSDKVASHINGLEDKVFSKWNRAALAIPQGYTYLGQFLAHEIAPRAGVNTRTWKIDLDSLYPPFDLSTSSVDQATAKFRYQEETCKHCVDLLRGHHQKALIPEFRNDDQLIIAQLHLLFQLFHNKVTDELIASSKFDHSPPFRTYQHAKSYVTATFQRIVMEDYLDKVCAANVLNVLKDPDISILYYPDFLSVLPVEITHAVGRFGHAQVRGDYVLNGSTNPGVKLDVLFKYTGEHSGSYYRRAPLSFAINWSKFFDIDGSFKSANGINPRITNRMRDKPEPNVVFKNLSAGVRKKLTSGQKIATLIVDELGKQGLGTLGITKNLEESDENSDAIEYLKLNGFWEETPLWLFILLEADRQDTRGHRLGPLGSLILIETIKNCMHNSGIHDYGNVQDFYSQFGLPPISTMPDLVKFTI